MKSTLAILVVSAAAVGMTLHAAGQASQAGQATAPRQIGYIKASNPGDGDQFGSAVAMSGDGNTLAVGAPMENSAAKGINGDQASDAAEDAGAVYVYARNGAGWTQQA